MILSNEHLKAFFRFFNKEISDTEISILKGDNFGELYKNSFSLGLINKVAKYKEIFSFMPFIKEVFICNNIAFGCANDSSDIDIFIVTENGKIWTVRILITLVLSLFGLRRFGSKIQGRFCLSFFATENGANNLQSIQIQKGHDPYLAIWTATLIPVLNTGYYGLFKENNSWIKHYGLNYINKEGSLLSEKSNYGLLISNLNKLLRIVFGLTLVEKFLRFLFEKRSINKMNLLENKSGTIISSDYLKFHDNDIRLKIKNFLDF